jgi:penicillin-binding protein 1C
MTKDDLRDILVNNEQAQQDPATEANTAEAQTADFGRPVSENAGKTRENSVKNKFSQIFHQMYSHIKNVKIPIINQRVDVLVHQAQSKAQRTQQMILRQRARSRRQSGISIEERRLRKIKIVRTIAMAAAIGAVAMVFVFFGAFAWYSRELPKPGEVVRKAGYSTQILDRNGKLLYDLYDEERRKPVAIDQVPEHLKHAVIATEDKDFYKHEGFDFMTIVRIPYNIVFRQRVVGGSTLTQQLVKNALLTNERSLERKFKELVLSLQIERKFSKDEILNMYLNEAPYGGTAWGIGTAAEMYFNKQVNELNLVESAILAGLPQRPTAYSPYAGRTDENGTPLWKVRTLGVLRRMLEDGYITQLAHDEAVAELDQVEFDQAPVSINAPHFVFYVKDLLSEMYGEDVVETGGFRVTTTLDLDLHNEAQKIVTEEVDKVADSLNISNGAVMVMDPRTGEVLSMVGSRDYNNSDIGGQFNVPVDGLRQPGSAIKPVTYLGLLQRGYTPASMLVDVPTTFQRNSSEPPYEPKNYDGTFRGPVSVRNSLGSSLNIPAVKALAIVGIDNFLSLAYDMGLDTLEPTEANRKRFGLAVTLGGAEVRMIDLVSAYSAFANGGRKVEPVSILKVEDKDGNKIFEHRQVEGRQVIQEEEAFLISNILSDNNARALAFGTNSLLNTGQHIAVKTGTTNEMKDNWAIGWSREVIVGSWVGNNDNTQMRAVASGVSGATPIWRRVILMALEKGYGAPAWEVPKGVEQVEVDQISGYPAHNGFPSRMDYATKNTLPTGEDPIHQLVKVCRDDDKKLATDADVRRGRYDEKEYIILKEDDPFSQDGTNRWQIGIDNWLSSVGDERYKYPTDYCGDEDEIYVSISEPKDKTNYKEEDIRVKVEADQREGIEKIELYVNGEKRETMEGRKFDSVINLPRGKYTLRAIAYARNGDEKKSSERRIGTGGMKWDAEDEDEEEAKKPDQPATGSAQLLDRFRDPRLKKILEG